MGFNIVGNFDVVVGVVVKIMVGSVGLLLFNYVMLGDVMLCVMFDLIMMNFVVLGVILGVGSVGVIGS